MIHRFAGVPIMSMYYGFRVAGIPHNFGARGVCDGAIAGVARRRALAVTLFLVGGDFSYLAAGGSAYQHRLGLPAVARRIFWRRPWKSRHFATWGPSLVLFWTALVAIVEALRRRTWGWVVMSALVIGVMFQFKPFAYVVLLGGLGGAAVFTRDWTTRLRVAAIAVLGVLFTAPFLIAVSKIPAEDRRSHLVLDP